MNLSLRSVREASRISMDLLLYTGASGVLFHVEWCIRQAALIFFYHTL